MALKPCRECDKEVSSEAKTCPHCGIDNPAASIATPAPAGGMKQFVGGVFLLLLVGFGISRCMETSDEDRKKAAEKEAACKTDIQCWGDKNLVTAAVACQAPIEKLARFSARWTDKTMEPKFSRFRWLDQEKGLLTYIGDKIEFQNGFGAYQASIYECDIDPVSRQVLEVRAQPGRL